MRFEPFHAQHLSEVTPQPDQAAFLQWMTPDIAERVAEHFAFTGFDEAGAIVGCAGIAPVEDEMVAWAVFSERVFAYPKAVMRAVKAGLSLHRGQRIMAYVAVSHVKAARFAEALDFQLAGRVTHPNGAELFVYALER